MSNKSNLFPMAERKFASNPIGHYNNARNIGLLIERVLLGSFKSIHNGNAPKRTQSSTEICTCSTSKKENLLVIKYLDDLISDISDRILPIYSNAFKKNFFISSVDCLTEPNFVRTYIVGELKDGKVEASYKIKCIYKVLTHNDYLYNVDVLGYNLVNTDFNRLVAEKVKTTGFDGWQDFFTCIMSRSTSTVKSISVQHNSTLVVYLNNYTSTNKTSALRLVKRYCEYYQHIKKEPIFPIVQSDSNGHVSILIYKLANNLRLVRLYNIVI